MQDNRDLVRCVACHHLTDMHSDSGCLVQNLDSSGLVKCSCICTLSTVQTYRGALSYDIPPVDKELEASWKDLHVQAEMTRVRLAVLGSIDKEYFPEHVQKHILMLMTELQSEINTAIQNIQLPDQNW